MIDQKSQSDLTARGDHNGARWGGQKSPMDYFGPSVYLNGNSTITKIERIAIFAKLLLHLALPKSVIIFHGSKSCGPNVGDLESITFLHNSKLKIYFGPPFNTRPEGKIVMAGIHAFS